MVVIELIYNLAILVAFSVLSGFIDTRYERRTLTGKILQGILFGTVAVIGMLYPFVLTKGIIFDGRSVVINLATFFFGPLTGIITAGAAAIYRLYLGGGGLVMGELVIFTSFIVGYLFYRWRRKASLFYVSKSLFYVMGLIVHTLMVLYMFILPAGWVLETFYKVALTVIIFYPLITLIIGKILLDQELGRAFMDEIKGSQQLYRSTFYSIGDGVITSDKTGKITRMNETAQKLTGWTELEAIGENINKVFRLKSESAGVTVESPVDYVLKTKTIKKLDKNSLLISRDGEDIPVAETAAPVVNQDGEAIGVVIIFRDQTNERNYQNELKERERQLSTLMSNLPGMAYRCKNDPEWTMVFVSDGCFDLTGLKQDELLQNRRMSYSQIIHPDFVQYVWDEVQSSIRSNTEFRLSYKIITAAGIEKWVWEQGRGIYDFRGELLFLEGFITDITERKLAADRLQFYNERLKLISSVAGGVIGKLPVKDTVNNMLGEIINAFKVDAGLVRLITEDGLIKLANLNIPDEQIVDIIPADFGLAKVIVETGKPIAVTNTQSDQATMSVYHYNQNKFRFLSYAGAPLFAKDKIIGIVGLYTVNYERQFSAEDLDHLQIAANIIAAAIENNRLFDEVTSKKSELEGEIASRVRTERRLLESEATSELIIRSTNVVLYRLNYANHKYDYMTPVIQDLTGYSLEELNDIGFKSVVVKIESMSGKGIDSNDLEQDKSHLEREFHADYLVKKKNGEYCWLSDISHPWFDEKGILTGSIGVLTDITSRKAMERSLAEQRHKFMQLFENSPVAIILLDSQNRIMEINESFSRLFGYGIEEVRGKNPDDIIVPDDLAQDASELSRETSRGVASSKETFRVKKYGEKIFVKVAGIPVISEGEVIAIYAMYVDLTERKKSEEEIRAAKEKAEEMSRLKSHFLANMSHELRTPLIGILGFSEIMIEEAIKPEIKQMAQTINKSGSRLLETLNLILDLSRVEAGRLEMKKEQVNICQIISGSINLFSEAAAQKGLYLRQDIPEESVFIRADSKMLEQVMNNLLNNALKFTTEGGVIVTLIKHSDKISVSVADTGIGISEHDQEIIWEEFRQASEGYSRSFEGTGLGLAITKRFIEKLGGAIRVKSELHRGAEFIFEIPLESSPFITGSSAAGGDTLTEEISGSELPPVKKKVLLVEDDPVAVDLINAMLGKGFDLEYVNNGEAGIKKAKSFKYDLVLMDINLGKGISGIEVTKQLKSLPEYANVPIIAVTAFAMVGDREEFLAAGCTQYLSKPFTRRELLSVIREAMGE
ncbi:MAG: PAS domain S-box protein [Ignavibacteriaceae bacterium]|nr:PAS domain S-box protein [Ignavibacteriaceae bacterium]